MKTEEQKRKHAEYMRDYLRRNPEKYENMKLSMKKYVENNRQKIRDIKAKYRKTHVLELRARKKANKYMELKEKCEICGDVKNLQFHHWRYDKPKLVNTLCGFCHGVQHSRSLK